MGSEFWIRVRVVTGPVRPVTDWLKNVFRPIKIGKNWAVYWVFYCWLEREASRNTCFLMFCTYFIDLQEEASCYGHLFVRCPKDENSMSLSRENSCVPDTWLLICDSWIFSLGFYKKNKYLCLKGGWTSNPVFYKTSVR
jgi:hypothetical protein